MVHIECQGGCLPVALIDTLRNRAQEIMQKADPKKQMIELENMANAETEAALHDPEMPPLVPDTDDNTLANIGPIEKMLAATFNQRTVAGNVGSAG